MHFGPLEIVAAQPTAVTLNLLFPLARCPLRARARGRSPSPPHPLAPSRRYSTAEADKAVPAPPSTNPIHSPPPRSLSSLLCRPNAIAVSSPCSWPQASPVLGRKSRRTAVLFSVDFNHWSKLGGPRASPSSSSPRTSSPSAVVCRYSGPSPASPTSSSNS